MRANATNITASDNVQGYFCGTCHNGKLTHDGKRVFAACTLPFTTEDLPRCERCHQSGERLRQQEEFDRLTRNFPRERGGNGINWEKAEEGKFITPLNYLEGVSIKRGSLKVQKDFSLEATVAGMPKIVFSHRKHTVWNGCEVCHPDIFVGVKRGNTKYSMVEIYDGKYCGVCHGRVSFPNDDCTRCHTESVT